MIFPLSAPVAAAAMVTTFGAQTLFAASSGATITEYPIPSLVTTWPSDVRRGADGALWFPETTGHALGRVDLTTKHITQYPIAGSVAPSTCHAGSPGSNTIVFSDVGNNTISTMDIGTHAVTSYHVPTSGAVPVDVAPGPDGALWFTETAAGKIGRLDLGTGSFSDFPIPNHLLSPLDALATLLPPTVSGYISPLSAGALSFDLGISGGKIWFGEFAAAQIVEMDPYTHVMTGYSVPTPAAGVFNVTPAQDGGIWFTETAANRIGRFDPVDHTFREFPIPTLASTPFTLHGDVGSDPGGIYFVEGVGNRIGRVDISTGQITEHPLPRLASVPADPYSDSTLNSIYICEIGGNAIAELTPTP